MPLAIIKPVATVIIFWTIVVRVSPTRVLTIEASTDNLAPIVPLKKIAQTCLGSSKNCVPIFHTLNF